VPAVSVTPLAASDPVGDDGIERDDGPPPVSHFNVGLAVDSLFYTQQAFGLFSTNDVFTSVDGSVGFSIPLSDPWTLVPEVGFAYGSADGDPSFGGAVTDAKLKTWRPHAGVRVRYLLLPWLEPHARLAAGVDRTIATVRPDVSEELQGANTTWFGSLGAGITVHTKAGGFGRGSGGARTLIIGGTLEGGYSFAPSLDLNLAPEGAAPRLQTSNTSLGSLGRSAPYIRVALDLRF
jgi:hypothetical protein